MKRATVTIPDDLEKELADYLKGQDAPPSLTALMQAALREYLQSRKLAKRQYRPPLGPLELPVAERGSGREDISLNHDRYLTNT